MAKINLLDLEIQEIVGGLAGQKVMVYSGNSRGKTFQLTKTDRPILLMTESGGNGVRCRKVPITKWSEFMDSVNQLTNEKTYEAMYLKTRSIVIDTGENLIGLAELATCNEFGVRDLSEIAGKSNGYLISRRSFAQQVNKLTSYGYTVYFICHEEEIEKLDELTGEVYTYIQPKGSNNEKGSMRFLRDLCDFTIYLKANGIDPETHEVIPSTAICKETKHIFARSRYAMQTFINPFTGKGLEEAMRKAIEKSALEEGSELVAFKPNISEYDVGELLGLIKPYFTKLHKMYPQEATGIVESQLGEGRKISSATEDERVNLETIYNTFVSMACDRGIVVDI